MQPPIAVGLPNGFDMTVDGSRLYVANTRATNLSVVDLATRREMKKIDVPQKGSFPGSPYFLAIAASGKALFSTSGTDTRSYGAPVMALDLATEVVSQRQVFFNVLGLYVDSDSVMMWYAGPSVLKASADHEVVAAAGAAYLNTPVSVYQASTDSFRNGLLDTMPNNKVAVSRHGTMIVVDGHDAFELEGRVGRHVPPPSAERRLHAGRDCRLLRVSKDVITAFDLTKIWAPLHDVAIPGYRPEHQRRLRPREHGRHVGRQAHGDDHRPGHFADQSPLR